MPESDRGKKGFQNWKVYISVPKTGKKSTIQFSDIKKIQFSSISSLERKKKGWKSLSRSASYSKKSPKEAQPDLDIRENLPSVGLEAVASLSLEAPNTILEKLRWGARNGDGAPSWP